MDANSIIGYRHSLGHPNHSPTTMTLPLSLSRSQSLSRSCSQSSHTHARRPPMTRREAYHICHTPTLPIPGGRVVANPHYIGPVPPPSPPPTTHVAAKKCLSRCTCTSKEYQKTGVRPAPAKLDREAGTSSLSTTSFVPVVPVDFNAKDAKSKNDGGVKVKTSKGRKLDKNVRFSDTILEKKFDLEDEDPDEDVYSALCAKFQREEEGEGANLTRRFWRKGKVGMRDSVKKTLKVVWNVVY